jgi:hypothetical protein
MANETNITVIEKSQTQKIAEFRPRFDSLIKQGLNLKVIDNETNAKATDVIKECSFLQGQYKKFREKLYKPIKDHIKLVESEIIYFEKELEKVAGKTSRDGLKKQKADYELKLEEERRQEEERLRKEQQKKYEKQVAKADKKGEIAPPPPPPVTIEKPKEEGVTYRDEFDFELIEGKENDIPRNLMIPDEKKIRKGVKAGVIETSSWIRVFKRKVLVNKEESINNL